MQWCSLARFATSWRGRFDPSLCSADNVFRVTYDSLSYSNWDIDKCRVSVYTVQDSDI